MIHYETNIDTFAIQMDFTTSQQQNMKLEFLINWIIGRQLGDLKLNEKKSSSNLKVYDLRYGGSKLATIHSGFARVKDIARAEYTQNFYIRIRWCGLKSFKPLYDDATYKALITICAFLNTTRTAYRFVELDVAIDMFCNFDNILGIVAQPVSNVPYNRLGGVQYFNGVPTSYLEDYSNPQQRKDAFMRFYIYNKSAKENLNFTVIRAELKLQNRFFLKNGFTLESINKAFNKYRLYYFKNPFQKLYISDKYRNFRDLNYSDLCRLEAENHRVNLNPSVIKAFICQVQLSYVDFYGNVTVPNYGVLDNVNLNLLVV